MKEGNSTEKRKTTVFYVITTSGFVDGLRGKGGKDIEFDGVNKQEPGEE
jgi:hypothetical protein